MSIGWEIAKLILQHWMESIRTWHAIFARMQIMYRLCLQGQSESGLRMIREKEWLSGEEKRE